MEQENHFIEEIIYFHMDPLVSLLWKEIFAKDKLSCVKVIVHKFPKCHILQIFN